MAKQTGALGIIEEANVETRMRDGTILRGDVFRPATSGRRPALLVRTPYGKGTGIQARYARFVRAGYAVMCQDTRGRYESDGAWVPFTVEETGDAEDGYDTVEWLARRSWCNGKVGTMGASYLAWMQWKLAALRPPHLVAMSAQTIPLELTDVDWRGGFRPGRRIRWWMGTMAPDIRRRQGLPGPHTPAEGGRIWDEIEHGKWLGLLPWIRIAEHLPPGLAEYADDWLRHPNRRAWKFAEAKKDVSVPNLDFTGWYDHCSSIGHLQALQKRGRTKTAREQSRIVIGPWNHAGLGERTIADIDFGPQARIDMVDMMIRWFDYWLKGLRNGVDHEPQVRYFMMGAGEWRSSRTWPPRNTKPQTLYLGGRSGSALTGRGRLTAKHAAAAGTDRYRYDPHDPVPTLWSPRLFTEPSDRSKLRYRQDVLYYRTPALTADVDVAGGPEVILHASSSAPDTDFFARLVDEHPDGTLRDMCYGMVRARHRKSLDREDFLTPGEVTELRVRLGSTACRFVKGHRIGLEITSSDFPNHDRNHNTGRNDLLDPELTPADQAVHHSKRYPSRLVLPCL